MNHATSHLATRRVLRGVLQQGSFLLGGGGRAALINGIERVTLNSDITEGWGMPFIGWKRKGQVFSCRLSPPSAGGVTERGQTTLDGA